MAKIIHRNKRLKPKYQRSSFELPMVRHDAGLECSCLNCCLDKYEKSQVRE